MALTWTELESKFQRLARSANSDVLTQGQQDMNTGYHLFNAKLSRYFTRKQQFADLVAQQQIYQTPVDCVRVMGMTVLVSATYQPTVKEIRSEYEWRQITSYPMASNWPTYYFMIGNDELGLWPIPSQSITAGLRFYYQPQDHDLSVEDITNTSTGQTVTVANGSNTVTATGSIFTAQMVGLNFQVTGITDNTWYEITGATANTLTLKSNYVGVSASGQAWRVGQLSIIPQEYSDAPIHYALSLFFSAQGNEPRALEHMNLFQATMNDCLEEYSSSNESSVITYDDDVPNNIWLVPPPAG